MAFLKMYSTFTCCWLLPYNATKFQIVRDRLFRLFSVLHAILLLVQVMYAIFFCTESIRVKMILCLETIALLSVPIQISLFMLYHDSLQSIIHQIENYYKRAIPIGKKISQELINKYINTYITVLVIITIAAVSTIVEPFLHVSGQFPLPISYTFPQFHKQPLKTIVYLQYSFGVYQAYCQMNCTFFVALWFSSARFEILFYIFPLVKKYSDWQLCVQEHQELLRFTQKMRLFLSYMIMGSISFSTCALVFIGVIILSSSNVADAAYDMESNHRRSYYTLYFDVNGPRS